MIPAPDRRMRRQAPDSAERASGGGATSARAPPAAPRWSRRRGVLGVFAAFAAVGFVAAYVGPTGRRDPTGERRGRRAGLAVRELPRATCRRTTGDKDAEPHEAAVLDRGSYTVYVTPKPTPTPTAVAAAKSATGGIASGWRPPFVTPDPGRAGIA